MEIASLFIAAFLIMSASLIGVVFVWQSLGERMQKNLRYLISFSAGVFVMVSYGLFTEALEMSSDLALVVGSAVFGALLLEFATSVVSTKHHHHGPDIGHAHTRADARRVLLGDMVHNIADGILLVPAFLIDIRLGIVTAFAAFLHEVVQEISEFFIFKEAGYSTTRALTLNALVSSTILAGIIIGLFVAHINTLVPALIAFAAGAFLYVVFRDLLPSTLRSVARTRAVGGHLFAAALGVMVMFGVNAITPHTHAGSGNTHEASEQHDDHEDSHHNEHAHNHE